MTGCFIIAAPQYLSYVAASFHIMGVGNGEWGISYSELAIRRKGFRKAILLSEEYVIMTICHFDRKCVILTDPKKHRSTNKRFYVSLFYHVLSLFRKCHKGLTASERITAHLPITCKASLYPILRASATLLAVTTVCH
jgi:hypothetical protein